MNRRTTPRMTLRGAHAIVALLVSLAGCGSAGPSVPARFNGTWGADCSAPWVRFHAGKVHDFPGNADYPLKHASFDGSALTVTYARPDMEVTDTFISEGDTLRLSKTVGANGGEASWTKAPMSKCR